MRTMVIVAISCMLGSAACGGGGGGTGGGTGGGGGASSTVKVNDCDPSAAEDHTADNPLMIMFGDTLGSSYSPKCARIKAGSGVQFMGDLAAHPLAGGVNGEIDASSPIKETKTGMDVTFGNLPAGTYGYFCETHDGAGMHGAIVVE